MNKLDLRVRTLLLYIALAVIPVIVIFTFYMRGYIKSLEEDMANSLLQTLRQAALNISAEIKNARRITDFIYANADVLDSMRIKPEAWNINDQITEITKLRNIKTAAVLGSDIRALRLYVNEDKLYANQRIDFYPLDEFFADPLFENVTSSGVLISTYRAKYVFEPEAVDVVSFARVIKDSVMIGDTIGAVVVDIEESKIFSLLEYIEFTDECLAYVVDENGLVVSKRVPEMFGQVTEIPGDTEEIRVTGSAFYVTVPIGGSSWTLAAEMPREGMRGGYLAARSSLIVYLLLPAVFVGALLAVNIISINGITLRIQEIADVLIKEWGGAQYIAGGKSKKRGIYSSLDRSLEHVRELIRAIHSQMETQRRTQLQLLQSQINPHFLYNTLDTVQWLVRARDVDNAEEAIHALTCYLRLILNNGRDEVTVEDEVNLVDAYMSIQKLRFGAMFRIEFIIEPDAANCLLPKLTIQPIIENAITHGLLKLQGRSGRIDVDIYTEGDTLNISVTDNGAGMPSDAIETLLLAPADKHSGFGLYNVRQRILLFSGDGDFGADIESEEGKYTTVHLKIAKKIADEYAES